MTVRSHDSVGAAGDVNGDGVDDIIIGAFLTDPPNGADAGIAYVIFGRSQALQISYSFSNIQLTNGETALHSSVGFRIGVAFMSGDVNNDGIDDIIVWPNNADRSQHDIVAVCRGVR